MKEVFAALAIGIGALFLVMFLSTIGGFYQFAMFSYFAPKVVEVQSRVFHESQQYNDGMLANLSDLMLEYKQAKTQSERDAIAAVVRQQYGRYPQDKMPANL